MAEVTLQVKVVREQVDKLQKDIDKLRKTTINISAKEATQNLKQAQQALRDVEKTEQAVLKTERERLKNAEQQNRVDAAAAKAEKERAQANAQNAKATKDLAKAETEVARQRKEQQRAEESAVRTERQRLKLTQDQEKAEKQATVATEEGNEAVKKQGLLYDILGRNLSSFIARMTMYRAVYAGIRAITNGFTEALQTLKAVDDELVTVRKVTGFDQYQMAEVEQQAYAVASKYGTSAADYTSSVAAFARAGYKDLSGDLAELAEKTKIVGDTTADVAQQFLLSVDAAYKYKGNIEALTAVLDGANEIDNKYATSIEKIAEGMGIVAPVAEQMNVGVDELAASIGTITAVTQRTGTEAARALRAIYLNIVGDTKTEIEEGVTWTTGEIEGLRDVIKLYAKDAYDAAQASGGIIDPMEAIAGLAKSVQDGVLTEAKLMEMVSDIGGKLRTSQLLAIVNNWDMYESMLETYRNAYGSAEAEVENAMDSWSRKTEVLKNKWTEFVKTGLNSGVFKTFLDILSKVVDRLGTLPGVLTRLIPLVAAVKFHEMAKSLADSTKAATGLAGALQKVGVSAKSLNWISAILAAIAAAWSAISYAAEDAKIKHEELVKAIYEDADAAKESADKIFNLSSEMDAATAGSDDFRASAKELADTLGIDVPAGVDAAIQKIKEYRTEALALDAARTNTAALTAQEEFVSAVGGAYKIDIGDTSAGGYNDILAQMAPGLAEQVQGILSGYTGGTEYGSLENARQYREAVVQIVDAIDLYILKTGEADLKNSEYYTTLKQFIVDTESAYDDMAEKEKQAFDAKNIYDFMSEISTASVQTKADLNDLINGFINSEKYTSEEKDALIALAIEYYKFSDAVEEATDELDDQADAIDEVVSAADRLKAANEAAEAAVRKLIPALFDQNGALNATGIFALEADKNLASMVQSELEAELAAKKANYTALVAQLAVVGITAAEAAQQIWQISRALAGDTPSMTGLFAGAFYAAGGGSDVKAVLAAKMAEINKLASQISAVSSYTGSGSSGGSSGGGSSGGGSGGGRSSSSTSTEDKKLTALRDRVTLLKSELSLMKERGDSEEDQIAKMREIQQALKNEWQYLEKIKGDKATINGLEQEWWQYENSITDMMDQQAKAAQEQAEALQKALDAQIALNNALKDRSVRYYNAATGQWEWGANAENVANARSALESAVASAGMTMDQWGLQYSMLSFANSKDRWLNGGVPSFNWDASAVNRGGTTNTSVGTNNYGATYNIAGVTLTESQARSMTVYELAQLSNSLAIQNHSV